MVKRKVPATSADKVRKEDLEAFVKKILEDEGYPPEGWKRCIFYVDGYLYGTDLIKEDWNIVWGPVQKVIFEILSK